MNSLRGIATGSYHDRAVALVTFLAEWHYIEEPGFLLENITKGGGGGAKRNIEKV